MSIPRDEAALKLVQDEIARGAGAAAAPGAAALAGAKAPWANAQVDEEKARSGFAKLQEALADSKPTSGGPSAIEDEKKSAEEAAAAAAAKADSKDPEQKVEPPTPAKAEEPTAKNDDKGQKEKEEKDRKLRAALEELSRAVDHPLWKLFIDCIHGMSKLGQDTGHAINFFVTKALLKNDGIANSDWGMELRRIQTESRQHWRREHPNAAAAKDSVKQLASNFQQWREDVAKGEKLDAAVDQHFAPEDVESVGSEVEQGIDDLSSETPGKDKTVEVTTPGAHTTAGADTAHAGVQNGEVAAKSGAEVAGKVTNGVGGALAGAEEREKAAQVVEQGPEPDASKRSAGPKGP